ncbi:EIN3-binding F-box protein 2 [Cynoglossus semilaevis]|uniref:F-box and leucine rich repeat protein n=1 Tax=Cynoglossus semilaevis TaxID=244447 RepID=A0A3P8X0E2_CYNSE|nr:EIN3-binding F-box protein 2-like [Cynoglossus semilaevis]XP_024912134.1 EIN3-binding F-box protein 2-like [Cynoglossus semilaevis]
MGDVVADGEKAKETAELPLEIIIHILSFLHPSDRKEASMVCHSWYNASLDLSFQKNVTFCFPASPSSLQMVSGLNRRSRCSLVISQLDGFSMSRSLLLEVGLCLGSKLDGLALPGSSITEASLLALLPCLTSLRKLDLRGLDSLFMSGAFLSREEHRQQVRTALVHLEELDLSDLRYLSDLTFSRLTSCTPRLRRLSLAGNHIAFEFDPYQGCPVGMVEHSSALLSLRNLRRLLTEQKTTLRALDLSRTSITPESLRTIAQVQGLVLEELRLHGCKELTDYSIEVLIKHQPSLQRLDISSCTELTSRTVEAVARGLKSLTHISLSNNWRITEKGLADLTSLSSLRRLDLSNCLHVSGAEMVKGLKESAESRARLETLSLKSCTYIGDLVVSSLGQLLGSTLQELDLTSCVNVTDLSVLAISTYLLKLVILRLGWCKEIKDKGLLGTVEKCVLNKKLEEKGPTFTRTFGNMGFFKPPNMEDQPKPVTQLELQQLKRSAGASLLALSRLQELDLTACSKLTDNSITQVVNHQDLHRLSLACLPCITDDSLVSVAWRCKSLTSLSLSHCPGISDRGVSQAAPYLRRLQHLNLSCCNNITDRSLLALAKHCKRLRTLDISRCKKTSVTTIDLLQSQLPFLENIQCKFIGGADPTLIM